MAPSSSSVLLTMAFATLALAVHIVAGNIITADSLSVGRLAAAGPDPRVKTCDGGHGVFTCETGNCYYNKNGAFACCDDINDCSPISSCIPGGNAGKGKLCADGDSGCISCSDKGQQNCFTVTNPAMHQYYINCWVTGGVSETSFEYKTLIPPSTLNGPPAAPSSTTTATSATSAPSTASTAPSSTSDASSSLGTHSVPSGNPTSTPPPEGHKKKLPSRAVGGIAVGTIAGSCLLGLALWLLFRWLIKQRNRDEDGDEQGGILPGPREPSNENKPSGDSGPTSTTSEMDTQREPVEAASRPISYSSSIPGPTSSHPGSPRRLPSALVSGYRRSGSSQMATAYPEETELSALPPSNRVSAATVPPRSPITSSFPSDTPIPSTLAPSTSPINPGSRKDPNLSPPFTATPTPVSPFFSVSAPTTAEAERLWTGGSAAGSVAGDLWAPAEEDENRRKSSKLLPMAGPYLTAERALGEGYWEAEREQLEADKAMKEAPGVVKTEDAEIQKEERGDVVTGNAVKEEDIEVEKNDKM